MEKVFTKNEFDKKIKSILLSKDYVDYNYYAVYIAKHIDLYFENPFDKNYYNIKDIKTVLGEKNLIMKKNLRKMIEGNPDYKKYGGMDADEDVLTAEEIEELENETEEDNAKR